MKAFSYIIPVGCCGQHQYRHGPWETVVGASGIQDCYDATSDLRALTKIRN
jgi:hypothetical protein